MPEKEVPPTDDEEMSESPEQFLDEPEEHSATIEHSMRVGDADVDVYTSEGREDLVEEDEISALEEGFAEGAENPEEAHCAHCGVLLGQEKSSIVEREVNHVKYLFCSDACAKNGVEHAKKK